MAADSKTVIAQAEWNVIREAFRTRDAVALVEFHGRAKCRRRARFALLLARYEFLPGCVAAHMELDKQMTAEEFAKVLDYLYATE